MRTDADLRTVSGPACYKLSTAGSYAVHSEMLQTEKGRRKGTESALRDKSLVVTTPLAATYRASRTTCFGGVQGRRRVYDLCKIFHGRQRMTEVPNAVEILPKI